MLQSLDILIGFAMVMAMMSLVITAMTQALSALLGWRGVYLKEGLQGLLAEAGGLNAADAGNLAQKILHHQLVSDSTLSASKYLEWLKWLTPLEKLFNRWKLASALRKDEMTAVLEAIEREGLTAASADEAGVAKAATTVLPRAAVIENWFDRSMDRVSQRFGTKCRAWTVAFALIVAFGVELDTFQLLTKLSVDPQSRAELIAMSDNLQKSADRLNSSIPDASSGAQEWPATVAALKDVQSRANEVRTSLGNAQFDILPSSLGTWQDRISPKRHLLGMLISGVLLSFGAPFWFNTLKSLLSLRSAVAESAETRIKDRRKP
jgi:hypothetical protein